MNKHAFYFLIALMVVVLIVNMLLEHHQKLKSLQLAADQNQQLAKQGNLAAQYALQAVAHAQTLTPPIDREPVGFKFPDA